MSETILMQKLEKAERIALGSATSRFLNAPIRYIIGQVHAKLLYPQNKKSLLRKARTFFGDSIMVTLPAGLDIYLIGVKSHPSEIRLAKYLINTVETGNIVLDIGAHLGYFTLLSSHLCGLNGRVISVEASTHTFETLKENTLERKNIKLINKACNSDGEDVQFYEFPTLYSEYNTMEPDQFKEEDWYSHNKPKVNTISSTTLDSLISKLQRAPDFIKIDVEGSEEDVIKGGEHFFKQQSDCIIIMEYLSKERSNDAHEVATAFMTSLGYKTYFINNSGLLTPIEATEITAYLSDQELESDNIVFKKD